MDNGWITHDGGPCPVPPETMVYVEYRVGIGKDLIAMPAGFWVANDPNQDAWVGTSQGNEPSYADIIAYKIVEDQ